MTADNEIARWATLEMELVNAEIPNLGPFDLELLGMQEFEIDPPVKENKTNETAKEIECPYCGEKFEG